MATKIKRIIFGEWFRGIGVSKYAQGFFDDLSNVDIVSEVGAAKCNLATVKESGGNITEPVWRVLTKSGSVYFFSKTSGNIWYRDTAGNYSSKGGNGNGSHYGAIFFDNWVYYWTQTKIGRFHADGEGSRDDNRGSFSHGSSPFHPAAIANLMLFIGDGNSLLKIDTHGNIVQEQIALEAHYDISVLKTYGYDLLIFTSMGNSTARCGVFRYDTVSVSWSSEDYVNEDAINLVISSDTTDEIFVQAGQKGNIYYFNGTGFQYYNTIRGVTSVATNWQNSAEFQRKALFAIGGTVYSLVVPQVGMQNALTKEYICSAGTGATIHSILGIGGQLLISWQLGGTYGVDKLATNYATASIDTPYLEKRITSIEVAYDSLPAGTSIGIAVKNDSGNYVSKTVEVDPINKIVRLIGGVDNERNVQARVTLNPSGNLSPVVQFIEAI